MRERILVVDDEPQVRHFIAFVLNRGGFDVIEADGAEQALAAVREAAGPIHLVLSDVHMPWMNGYELAALLTREYPERPILLMSANLSDDRARSYPMLRKPFDPSVLVERVRQVMRVDGPSAAT